MLSPAPQWHLAPFILLIKCAVLLRMATFQDIFEALAPSPKSKQRSARIGSQTLLPVFSDTHVELLFSSSFTSKSNLSYICSLFPHLCISPATSFLRISPPQYGVRFRYPLPCYSPFFRFQMLSASRYDHSRPSHPHSIRAV